MNAERLRNAAMRLREIVANKLNSDPREWDDDFPAGGVYGNTSTCTSVVMHPGVALALADWLDSTANDVQHVHDPIYNLTSTTVSRALLVADAVLGGGE